MALILPNSIFLHIPKCAGWSVRHAISSLGIDSFEVGHEHSRVSSNLIANDQVKLDKSIIYNKIIFTFVRHPISWYKSMWAYRMVNGWRPQNQFDLTCGSNDYLQFVKNVTNRFPGWYSALCKSFTVVDQMPIDFVGRVENLGDDLLQALKLANESFDATRFELIKYNKTNLVNFKSYQLASDDMDKLILESEKEIIDKYYIMKC